MDLVKSDFKYLVCASSHASRVLEVDCRDSIVSLSRGCCVIPLFAVKGGKLIHLPATNTYEDEYKRCKKEEELNRKLQYENGNDDTIEYGNPIEHTTDMDIVWNGEPSKKHLLESQSIYSRLKENNLLLCGCLVFKVSSIDRLMLVLKHLDRYFPFYFKQPERVEFLKNKDSVADIFFVYHYSVGG